MANSLLINTLERRTEGGAVEELHFTEGVNTIVGRKDAGKTVWLRMLDYLLGDPGTPEAAFGNLTDKYASISADAGINGNSIRIERRWKTPHARGKIFIDDEPYTTKEFSAFLLTKLGIPILHFPQGNPYSERAWPELSWRMLFRHIYRQETYWSDIADFQPESEQFAVLMQFLAIAGKLFPQQLGEVVSRRKRLFTLNAKKEQFQELIDSIASQMTSDGNSVQFATADVLNNRISELENQVHEALTTRDKLINKTITTEPTLLRRALPNDLELSERRNQLSLELDQLVAQSGRLSNRLEDLGRLMGSVTEELERLRRAKVAGSILHNIKITHCPACHQPVEKTRTDETSCFVCLRPLSLSEANDRLDFEIDQLAAEGKELTELVAKLEEDKTSILDQETDIKERLTVIDRRLQPIRTALGGLIDPSISILDAERGRLEEQIENYKRLLSLLDYRDRLNKEIEELTAEIAWIELSLEESAADLGVGKASDDLEDGIMTYLNTINEGNPERWPKGRVHVHLKERGFSFRIHGANWKGELGATTKCYFLLAYHYALLNLTAKQEYNYPGLSIIDFPPSLPDGTLISDMENFLVEPFVDFFTRIPAQPCQVIVAGRAFENLQGAHRIELETFWK
jgi:hypothetical protein